MVSTFRTYVREFFVKKLVCNQLKRTIFCKLYANLTLTYQPNLLQIWKSKYSHLYYMIHCSSSEQVMIKLLQIARAVFIYSNSLRYMIQRSNLR